MKSGGSLSILIAKANQLHDLMMILDSNLNKSFQSYALSCFLNPNGLS